MTLPIERTEADVSKIKYGLMNDFGFFLSCVCLGMMGASDLDEGWGFNILSRFE